MRLSFFFKKHNKLRRKNGFTMTEIIVTVGILAILLGVAVPGVAAMRDSLKMMELDACARQIFIATQNNLTSRKSAGTLDTLVSVGNPYDSTFQYATQDHSPTALIPAGAIDPTVLANYYVIKFNAKTGTVTEVFYAESSFDATHALVDLSGTDKIEQRRSEKVGFYNGGDLSLMPSKDLSIPEIEVENTDELTVKLKVDTQHTVLDTKLKLIVQNANNPALSFTLEEGAAFNSRNAAGETSIVLDSLYPAADGTEGVRFAKLARAHGMDATFPFDEQLRVYAQLEYIGTETTLAPSVTSNIVSTNGLYAQKNGDTVQIAYARHLQNLDQYRNPTMGLTADNAFAAEQIKNIVWPTGIGYVPAAPGSLMASYDGKNCTIENLTIPETTSVGLSGAAGLFSVLTRGSLPLDTIELKNITLISPSIEGKNFTYVGGLAGSAINVTADNCFIYYKDTTKGISASQTTAGSFAGGLFGSASQVTISNCSVGLPFLYGHSAGGLIGYHPNDDQGVSVIKNSYAAVDDMQVTADGRAAMFIALSSVATPDRLTIDRCYAVGNLSTPAQTVNGFIGGAANVKYSYSAVSYLKNDDDSPLGLKNIGGFGADATIGPGCYYLDPEGATAAAGSPGTKLLYDGFDLAKDGSLTPDFKSLYDKLSKALSHPYDPALVGEAYPFPGLFNTSGQKMPHYGSWPLPPKFKPAIAYIEQYENGTNGVFAYFSTGDKLDTLGGNEVNIKSTGYGVLLSSGQKADELVLTVLQKGKNGLKPEEDFIALGSDAAPALDIAQARELTLDGAAYQYVPFTASALETIRLNAEPDGSKDVLERRSALVQISAGANFANFQVHPLFGAAIAPGDKVLGVVHAKEYLLQIRTQEQLSNISAFQKTNPSSKSVLHNNLYEFTQTHNIAIAAPWVSLDALSGKSFNGKSENGVRNTITGLTAPLFSALNQTDDVISNVTIVNANIAATKDTGILAGNCSADILTTVVRNSSISATGSIALSGLVNEAAGTVTGCTVSETTISAASGEAAGFIRNISTIGLGAVYNCTVKDTTVTTQSGRASGFAGKSTGPIRGSRVYASGDDASYEKMAVTSKTGSAFGFVGETSGDIEKSSASVGVTASTTAAGFAGTASGKISLSYSASNVSVTGNNANVSGFVDKLSGTVDNCYATPSLTAKTGYGAGFAREITAAGKVTNSYAANEFVGSNAFYGFCRAPASKSSANNCYFLSHDGAIVENSGATALTYEKMVLEKGVTGELFSKLPSNVWASGVPSHPYDQTKLKGRSNPFPMLKEMDHYGDWIYVPEIPSGLVYFEKYDSRNITDPQYLAMSPEDQAKMRAMLDANYFISGLDSDNLPVTSLKNNYYTILEAGYGVLTDPKFGTDEMIKIYGYSTTPGHNRSVTFATPDKYAFKINSSGTTTYAGFPVQVSSRSYTLYPFKEETLTSFGNMIDWESDSLSLQIRIEHKDLKNTYLFAPFSASAVAAEDSGMKFGTKDTPAEVRTLDQFVRINSYMGRNGNNHSPHRYFKQTHDVEANGAQSKNSALISTMQDASYDGDNNTFRNSCAVLFVVLEPGTTISNLNIQNSDVNIVGNSSSSMTPGLLTYNNLGYILNCHVKDSKLTGNQYAGEMGGICGSNYTSISGDGIQSGIIENSSVANTVITKDSSSLANGAGGLAYRNGGQMINSYTENVTVTAGYEVGGFVVSNSGHIVGCYSNATALANNTSPTTMGTTRATAGFAVNNSGSINNSYATGSVSSASNWGQAAAFVHTNGGSIESSFANCTVNAATASGFAYTNNRSFSNNPTIKNCYTTSAVTASTRAAGFMAGIETWDFVPVLRPFTGKIINCYSAAKLNGASSSTAFVAFSSKPENAANASNLYYLDTFKLGTGTAETTAGTALTYAQMQTTMLASFADAAWRSKLADDPVPTYPFPVLDGNPHQGSFPAS